MKNVVGLTFCVANPITRTFKVLPREFVKKDFDDKRACWNVQLEVDADGHFTVIVLCLRTTEKTVRMYRSKDNSWEATTLTQPLEFSVTAPYKYDASNWAQYVLCNGELLTELNGHMNIHCLKSGRVIWERNRDNKNSDEDDGREPRLICSVFAWRGRIFCLDQDHEQQKVDFGVWELVRSPYIWQRVSFLPEHLQEMLLEPLSYRGSMKRRVTATLLGDTMYLSIATGKPDCTLILRELRLCPRLVAYNILDNTWRLICHGKQDFFFDSYPLFRPNGVGVCTLPGSNMPGVHSSNEVPAV